MSKICWGEGYQDYLEGLRVKEESYVMKMGVGKPSQR